MARLVSKLAGIAALLLFLVSAPVPVHAARTDALWDYIATGNYTQPNGSANGTNLFLIGSNHYINFGVVTGVNGYGVRDNAGSIECKNSGGSWAACSGGGGGSGTVTSIDVSGGSTGLTTSGGPVTTNGVITIGGMLNVAFGGTGSTTLTGVLKGGGTGQIQTAVPGTDYQAPVTLTTTGSSGAATFIANTLNIPQYSGGTTYTATYPVQIVGTVVSLAFGTSTGNTWGGTQTFTSTPVLGTLTGLVKSASGALSAAVNGTDFTLITALTCSAGQFLNSITAAGVLTCGTPSGTGSGLATSSPTANNQVLVYNSAGAGSAYSVATTSVTGNNGLTGSFSVLNTGGLTNSIGLATINAGVLGSPVNGAVPTSQATSTLFGTGTGGQHLVWNNGVPQWLATTTFSAPLVFAVGNVTITTASAGVTGALSGTDWSTFNNKQATISVTAPLRLTGTTIDWTGLATTSQPASSNLLVSNGLAGVYGVATSSETCTGVVSCAAHTVLSGGGAITITGGTNGQVLGWLSGVPAWTASTSVAAGTGISVATVGAANTVSLASMTAGVLGTAVTGVPTSQSTSTLYGASTGGMVLGWNNTTNGIAWIATSTGGGSGTVTSVGLSLPTGFTITNSPVTTTGTLTGAFTSSAFGIRKIPSYTVGATGADFTTIQGAMDACGTAGGGNIYLTDSTYAQGGTGLRWKGSNCSIWGRGAGTTTITFTGATTLFKTNSAAGLYAHNELHNLLLTADGNTSGIAIDWSDMSHGIVDNVQTQAVGSTIRLDDTQDTTFYNSFTNIDANDNRQFCINASSTHPVNDNYFHNIFCGAPSGGGTAIQLNNGNGNLFDYIHLEPASVTGTKGLVLFDNTLSTNGGVWNNTFDHFYDEANGTGVQISNTAGGIASNGIQRNTFSNFINESNTTDWNVTTNNIAQNTFINAMDSNFSNPLNTFQGPFGIGTSTALASISTTPYAYFGVSPQAGVALNEFVIGSSTATHLLVNNSGFLGLGTTSPYAKFSLGGGNLVIGAATAGGTLGDLFLPKLGTAAGTFLAVDATGKVIATTTPSGSGGSPGGSATELQYRSGASTFGAISSAYSSTLPALSLGTTTFITNPAMFTIATTSGGPQLSLSAGAGNNHWSLLNKAGTFYLATSSQLTGATSTMSQLTIDPNGKIGIGGTNNTAAKISIGVTDANNSINTAFGFVATNPGGDSRIGATSGDHLTGITTGDGSTYGALYAYNYNAGVAENVVIGQFGGRVGIGATTTPEATLAVNPVAGDAKNQFLVGSTTATNFRIDNSGHVFAPNTTAASAAQTGYWCYDTNGQLIRDTAVCLVSALKFKKDIHDLSSQYGLAAVLQMKPITYFLKEPFGKNDAGQQIGFVADWSEKIVPQLVTHDSNGDVHGFNYEQYTAVLTKAIQEQQKEIEALSSGKFVRSVEENWQDGLIALLLLYAFYNELGKRLRK